MNRLRKNDYTTFIVITYVIILIIIGGCTLFVRSTIHYPLNDEAILFSEIEHEKYLGVHYVERKTNVLYMADGSTRPVHIFSHFASVSYPSWSPDGKHISFFGRKNDGIEYLYICCLEQETCIPLTPYYDSILGSCIFYRWSPDSKKILCLRSNALGTPMENIQILYLDTQQSTIISLPLPTDTFQINFRALTIDNVIWSPQNDYIVISHWKDIYSQASAYYFDKEKWEVLLERNPRDWHKSGIECLAISPDGSRLLFSIAETMYVRNIQMNTEDAIANHGMMLHPSFTCDGKSILFLEQSLNESYNNLELYRYDFDNIKYTRLTSKQQGDCLGYTLISDSLLIYVNGTTMSLSKRKYDLRLLNIYTGVSVLITTWKHSIANLQSYYAARFGLQ